MYRFILSILAALPICICLGATYFNPILPGFHPDPSCIFVKDWDDTFFCASSSFYAFPGIPIHASKDLQNFKLIGNVISRSEQLPALGTIVGATSGIWAPAIRYHEGIFYVTTTLVFDNKAQNDSSRWYNILFKTSNPYDPSAWSDALHFDFVGYDTSLFWHENGNVYVQGSHPWQVYPDINQVTIDLETGKTGPVTTLWAGTGGEAPEGPHIYYKDGMYYLMIAEGGTGLGHMETIARSKSIDGPYTPNPSNPILTNANTTQYFQTVGHADLFQDDHGTWWGVALSTRSGPEFITYPMGRETVLTPVTWDEGEWPIFEPVRGEMDGPLPAPNKNIGGSGAWIDAPDDLNFSPNSSLPSHFAHLRFPDPSAYTISPPSHPNTLRLRPSVLNLTGLDGASADTPQTFVGRRQVNSEFRFSVELEYDPVDVGEEAGVTVFLVQNHHIDLGVVSLSDGSGGVSPYLRLRTTTTTSMARATILQPLPSELMGTKLKLEIKACNLTHYAFRYGPAGSESKMQTLGYGVAQDVSYGFTGTMLGIYATANGGNGTTPAYFSEWTYHGGQQYIN